MESSDQLTLALQVVSNGAAALRMVARARGAAPGVRFSAEFTYKAALGPLSALAGLLGIEEPKPRARRSPRRRQPRRRVVAPSTALPEPPDLDGFDERVGVWDPDHRPYSLESNTLDEATNCRALLLEVIRRASYDWVLYRFSSKLQNRLLAENAHAWLFEEDQEGADWVQRQRGGKTLTSFLTICEMLELDPERVRAKVRTMTERDIMGAGRPAERRRHKTSDSDVMQSDDLRVFDIDIDSLPSYDPMFAGSSEG